MSNGLQRRDHNWIILKNAPSCLPDLRHPALRGFEDGNGGWMVADAG